MNIDREIADLKSATADLFAPYQVERDIALLVRDEFSIECRIARAAREHRARRHLRRAYRLAKVKELSAA